MPVDIKRLAHVRLHRHPFFGLCYLVFTPSADTLCDDVLHRGFYDQIDHESYVYHLTRDLVEAVSHISPKYQLAAPHLSEHFPGEPVYLHVFEALHFLVGALPLMPVVELCFKRAFNFHQERLEDESS